MVFGDEMVAWQILQNVLFMLKIRVLGCTLTIAVVKDVYRKSRTYSREHISLDKVFSKILKKPSIVQK